MSFFGVESYFTGLQNSNCVFAVFFMKFSIGKNTFGDAFFHDYVVVNFAFAFLLIWDLFAVEIDWEEIQYFLSEPLFLTEWNKFP